MKYLNVLIIILFSVLTIMLIYDFVNAIFNFKEYKIGHITLSLSGYLTKNLISILFCILLIILAIKNYFGKLNNFNVYLYYFIVVLIILYTIYSYWQWYKTGYDIPD